MVPFWAPLCAMAAVFRHPVPFCEGLRRAHNGLFAGSFPGPSHQCGDAKHHTFSRPWPRCCHRKHMAGVCSPLPPRKPPLQFPSMAAWAEPVSALALLHPCYSRVSFFFSFFFPPPPAPPKHVGTTLSLKEEGFLSMLLLFRSLRMILAIVATCGLFSLHKKGE